MASRLPRTAVHGPCPAHDRVHREDRGQAPPEPLPRAPQGPRAQKFNKTLGPWAPLEALPKLAQGPQGSIQKRKQVFIKIEIINRNL